MSETRLGHFGLPGLLVAACAVAALVLLLAVPYAHIDYRDQNQDDQWVSWSQANDLHKNDQMVGASSPGLTLAGTIILCVAGLGLLVLGFLPLTVTSARWIGWSLALLAIVGGLMAFMSSMLWVGSGLGQYPYGQVGGFNFNNNPSGFNFNSQGVSVGGLTGGVTGLVEMALGTDSAGTVWIVGPVFVAALSALCILSALTLCGDVVSLRDGLRERAQRHLANARWALLLLALCLLLPWSIAKATDYEGQGDTDWFVYGAHTVMNTDAATGGNIFHSMAYAMNVFIAAGWIGVLLGAVGAFGGLLASEDLAPELARTTHFAVFGTLFMTLYAGILYILAWSYMWRPADGVKPAQPGYFPILVLPVLVLWALGQVRQVMARRNSVRRDNGAPQRAPVSFD